MSVTNNQRKDNGLIIGFLNARKKWKTCTHTNTQKGQEKSVQINMIELENN